MVGMVCNIAVLHRLKIASATWRRITPKWWGWILDPSVFF